MGKKAKVARKEYRAALARVGSQLLTQAERFKYSEADAAVTLDKGNDIQTALHSHVSGGGSNPSRDLQHEQDNAGRVHDRQAREAAHEERERVREERKARRLDAQLRRNHQRAVQARLRRERKAKSPKSKGRRLGGKGRRGKGRGGKGKTQVLPTFLQHESRQTIHDLTHGDYDHARVPAGSSQGGQFTSTKGA